MGHGITGSPNTYPAGLDFDYSVWTPGTRVDLINVNWDNSYRDTVRFESKTALNDFINSRAGSGVTVENMTYAKPGQDVYLPIPYNRVNRYNYLRASNPLMPTSVGEDVQKDYYYFILDSEMIAPGNTRLRLQLDVWQTYIYDVEIGNCYVERGHIGIANENAFDNYGRDYLSVPEGLDMGGEYKVVTTRNRWVMTTDAAVDPPSEFDSRYPGSDVLVIAATDLTADAGDLEDPVMKTAKGTSFEATPQGAGIYIFSQSQFLTFMTSMTEKSWITQGITSVSLIPKFKRYHPEFEYSSNPAMGARADSLFPQTFTHNMWPVWRSSEVFTNYLSSRYAHLRKFWTYPYMAIELTTFNATPIILKPEAWNTAHARLFERAALLPPAQRVEFSPRYYNAINNSDDDLPDLYPWYNDILDPDYYSGVKGDDYGEYIDLVTQIANFPSMTVVNSGQISYLASNAHGLAFQRQSADWTQQRALGFAQGQYDIATGAMGLAMDNAGSAGNREAANTATQNRLMAAQALNNGALGAAGSAALMGPLGAVSGLAQGLQGGINAGLNIRANDESLANNLNALGETTVAENRQSQLVRDTNKSLADWGAKGDYANQIAGISAKVQDAALIQPTTSGQIGGELMNLVNGGWQVSLRWKMIDEANVRTIGEFWLRYGYAIHAFIKPPKNLMVMTKFTYWKMLETYVASATVPEGHRSVIRGILEKGVTVWKNPTDIGVIDIADNDPLEGISY